MGQRERPFIMNAKIVICLIISVTAVNGCNNGWEKSGAYCFLFSHDKVTWPEASEICRGFEGFLAEPTTPEIDNFLSNRVKQTNPKKIFWLGASDIEKEGAWSWVTSRLGFGYTNWLPPDPNNAGAGEDCLLNNWVGQGKWEDGDCEWLQYFICQT